MKNLSLSIADFKNCEWNICGATFKVQFLDDERVLDFDRQESLNGCVNPRKREIRVFTGNEELKRSDTDVLVTVLHEIAHAVIMMNKPLSILIPEKDHEPFVAGFCTQLADTLVRNNLVNVTGLSMLGGYGKSR